MTGYSYLKVSQGFANTVIYLRVPTHKVGMVNEHFAGYEDDSSGRWCKWTTEHKASLPGMAVDWDDRAHVGL